MKRLVLLSLGLIFVAGYAGVGCLPADNGMTGTPGAGGSGNTGSAGTGNPGSAGTGNPGAAGDQGTGGTGGDTSGAAGSSNPGSAGSNPGSAGSTAGDGAGGTGTPGAAGNGAGGNPGSAGSTAGNGAAGNGPGGRGGSNGGNGPAGRGGNSAGGTGGSAGAGGSGPAGRGGSSAGAGGSAAGTTGTGGAGGDLKSVAAMLDGQMLLGPCGNTTQASVCATATGTCPNTNVADVALRGVLTTNRTITLGGTMGQSYTIQLHIQGEVESKNYSGGMEMLTTGTSPTMNGWHMGGAPATNNNYNVYMIRVTNPGATTHTDYFLNSMDPPGVENHTTYGMDYTTPDHASTQSAMALVAQGGASLQLVAADSNCSMIKNCGPTANDGSTCAQPLIIQNIESTSVTKNSSFNFNTAYNGQWIVMTVKNVTSP